MVVESSSDSRGPDMIKTICSSESRMEVPSSSYSKEQEGDHVNNINMNNTIIRKINIDPCKGTRKNIWYRSKNSNEDPTPKRVSQRTDNAYLKKIYADYVLNC